MYSPQLFYYPYLFTDTSPLMEHTEVSKWLAKHGLSKWARVLHDEGYEDIADLKALCEQPLFSDLVTQVGQRDKIKRLLIGNNNDDVAPPPRIEDSAPPPHVPRTKIPRGVANDIAPPSPIEDSAPPPHVPRTKIPRGVTEPASKRPPIKNNADEIYDKCVLVFDTNVVIKLVNEEMQTHIFELLEKYNGKLQLHFPQTLFSEIDGVKQSNGVKKPPVRKQNQTAKMFVDYMQDNYESGQWPKFIPSSTRHSAGLAERNCDGTNDEKILAAAVTLKKYFTDTKICVVLVTEDNNLYGRAFSDGIDSCQLEQVSDQLELLLSGVRPSVSRSATPQRRSCSPSAAVARRVSPARAQSYAPPPAARPAVTVLTTDVVLKANLKPAAVIAEIKGRFTDAGVNPPVYPEKYFNAYYNYRNNVEHRNVCLLFNSIYGCCGCGEVHACLFCLLVNHNYDDCWKRKKEIQQSKRPAGHRGP